MSEHGDEARGEYGEGDDALEETAAAASANNSIIGKMRSGVTSILPNRFSKWFSPSANNNNSTDTMNGSYGIAIKRNRQDAESHTTPQIKIHPYIGTDEKVNMVRGRRIQVSDYQNEEDEDHGDGIENDADESNHSDDIQINAPSSSVQRRRSLNVSIGDCQPPSKRTKMALEESMLSVRPLIASTPAVNVQRRSGVDVNHHYGHMNLYPGINKKELGYNFYGTPNSSASYEQQNMVPDIIDLIPIPMSVGQNDAETTVKGSLHISSDVSRSLRTLNIPPLTVSQINDHSSLKRQPLNTLKRNMDASSKSKQQNNQPYNDIEIFEDKNEGDIDTGLELDDVVLNSETYNGRIQTNGVFEEDLRQRSPPTDSEVEDGDTLTELPRNTAGNLMLKTNMSQRGASSGLFNMSAGNSRNGSRTSSFGNGLNFYTHLEGRKSLFSGPSSTGGGRANIGNALNSSTLSLNSLNRRQFNASIYGSTSALSDSRLLNTSSPFYKGNTTYGGAAAYSKYNNIGSTSRLTPTLIRPTSSLSTLSTSSNSIAAGITGGENCPAISGTAKTIFDLINGFTTPLSEAKKMATNLRQSTATTIPQSASKSKRLTDADIHASRAMRLQQVRTPYMRPTVMLQPKKQNTDIQQMPPVRELQVPSMSQLLQMKKLQNSTERSRQITMQKANTQDCQISAMQTTTKPLSTIERQKLSSEQDSSTENKHQQQQQQKHVNKIKHKINNPLRAPDTTENESPPLPADLPNIEFPLMKELPKIDIVLPIPNSKSNTFTPVFDTNKIKDIPKVSNNFKSKTDDGFTFSTPIEFQTTTSGFQQTIVPSNVNFTFSQPTSLDAISNSATKHKLQFENTAGLPVVQATSILFPSSSSSMQSGIFSSSKPAIPTLKTGSVLDALKKPITISTTSVPPPLSTFGNQFKKSADEWECDTCMVRNKNDISKCVSCDTLRKTKTQTEATKLTPTPTLPHHSPLSSSLSGFGNQFKKTSNEWECDTCMVRNKNDTTKCVSCETPRKTITDTKPTSQVAFPLANTNTISIGFGNQFKKQSNEWECDTCMVRNKAEASKCISCETARKGETKSTISQSFGNAFKPAITTTTATTTTTDVGFKSLVAAQKASTWECDVCMTRNNATCSKCVCCEQLKPGSTGETQQTNASSFSFGATAASKYSFGFGSDASKENELRKKELASSPVKTEDEKSTNNTKPEGGLVFNAGSTTQSGSGSNFSFGLQTKPSVTTTAVSTTVKDSTDSATKPSGFTFGLGNTLSPKSITVSDSSGVKLSTTTAPTTTSAITSFTPPKNTPFSFGIAKTNTTTTSNTSISTTLTTTTIAKPQESGFSFGLLNQKSTDKETTNQLNSSSSGFAFSSTATTTKALTTNTNTTTTTTTITPIIEPSKTVIAGSTFNFKGASTTASTAATTTTTVPTSMTSKPMFSFSVPSVPNTATSTTVTSLSSTSTTITPNNSGFSFTKSSPLGSAGTKDIKPLFGLGTSVNTTASTNNSITFGGPTFGTSKPLTSNVPTTVTTTAASTFGGFNFGTTTATTSATSGKTESSNLFGSMIAKTQTQDEQKLAPGAKQLFGNTTETSSSSTWPKNTFLFGSGGKTGVAGDTASSVFGSLKSETAATTTTAAPIANVNPIPIFGTASTSLSTPAFGNSSNSTTSTIFGTSTTSGLQNTTSLFGSKDNTVVPQFGGMSNSVMPTVNPTTFGSGLANAAPIAFGGFGATTATASSTTKTEPIAQATTSFSFEAPQTLASSGGYNFGSSAPNTARPAFQFTSTNPPTYNFTGGSSETTQPTTRPFQFGAAAAAPSFNPSSVFSFGGATSTENSSNTPFQFNAGATTQNTNNIFAPAPTASTTAQASRRKVRITTRRLTPR